MNFTLIKNLLEFIFLKQQLHVQQPQLFPLQQHQQQLQVICNEFELFK